MSKELSRRQFLTASSGMLGFGLLAACTDRSRSFPTPLPTVRPTPYPTLIPATPEIRQFNIPGIEIATRRVEFRDITSELNDEKIGDLNERLSRRELYSHNNESTAFFGSLDFKDWPHIYESLYYSNKDRKMYAGFGLAGRDEELFGWPGIYDPSGIEISQYGVVAYGVAESGGKTFQNGIVIADIPNSTKTIIKNTNPGRLGFQLSDDGTVLVLHPWSAYYEYDIATQHQGIQEAINGAYILDLKNRSLVAHLQEPLSRVRINEDGSLLYTSKGDKKSEIINIKTGKRISFSWPVTFSRYDEDDQVSPNFKYIATKIGMFSSTTTEPGQWGTMVLTPKEFLLIYSPRREASFEPIAVTNDGTIYCFNDYTLKPDKDGIYREAIDNHGKVIKTSLANR